MRNRLLTYLLGIVAFLSLNGCVGALFPKDSEDRTGSGNIIINISSKAEVKAPLAAPDDDVINHLIVWLVKDGTVIQKEVLTPGAQTASVEFTGVQRGRHDIYIVANRSGLEASYEVGATGISGITSQTLDEIADKSSPSYTEADGVPAALKTYVDVAPGDNVVSAELIRSVGRLTIEFRNLIEEADAEWNYDMYIGDIFLSKRNQKNGYLFPGDVEISRPGNFDNLDFTPLGSLAKIPYNTRAVVFDQYLYETSVSADPLMMAFAAGIYKSNTPAGNIKYELETKVEYSVGDNTTSISSGVPCMIRSRSDNQLYLGVDGDELITKEFASDANIESSTDIENYMWVFEASGSGKYKIKNVDTQLYLTIGNNSAGVSSTPTDLLVNTSTSPVRFYNSDNYYLNVNGSNVTSSKSNTTNNTRRWYLRNVTSETSTSITFQNADEITNPDHFYAIQYINKYGEPVPLTHINRNEHVTLTVNVYYHTENGSFTFELEDWDDKDSNTTFD